jgi:hypothetical protein
MRTLLTLGLSRPLFGCACEEIRAVVTRLKPGRERDRQPVRGEHLIERGAGTIITVTLGSGFLPFPVMPAYAASKAGVHAYPEALRAQLDGIGVEVAELVPSAVATLPEHAQRNPRALKLDDFATEVMGLLGNDPTPHEILVKGRADAPLGRARQDLRRPRRPAVAGAGDDPGPSVSPAASQLVTVMVGACWYQLAISDDTCAPELKSTRSQSVPDQVSTRKPESGTAVTSVAESAETCNATRPPSSV